MRCVKTLLLAVVVGGLAASAARADLKPNPLFSDNVVLQRGISVPVWGTAEPGESVTFSLVSPDGKSISYPQAVVAGADGKWSFLLPSDLKAGSGYTFNLMGKSTITLKNVAVGDVWVCSGQSNMQWTLGNMKQEDRGTKAAAESANPNIRLFTVSRRPTPEPQATVPVTPKEGKWLPCTPETAIDFSAVGYFFGRDIQKDQNVPIGLINTSYGGTPAEAWTSKEGLEAEPTLKYYSDKTEATKKAYDPAKAEAVYMESMEKWKKAAAKAKEANKTPPRAPGKVGPGGITQNSPSGLYNGMIAPLLPFPVKGAIWYQGESNSSRAAEYRTLMPALIKDWRAKWQSDLPFFIVQLAPFQGGKSGVDYAELRDAQTHATHVLPKVGIAIITDVGDEKDIHPQRKEPVGQRLALAARAIAYGEKVEYSGPVFKSLKVEGDKAVVDFKHVDGGLVCNGEALAGFAVAGDDNVFHNAKAEIAGDTVVLTSDKVTKPVAVRFGWVNFAKPELNFFNKAGLPAVPFRTDDLPLTTAVKEEPKKPALKKAS